MGMIAIDVQGSFEVRERKVFSAINSGHADAVAQAIEYLAKVQLPAAIKLDHKLQGEGHSPNKGFAVRE